MDIFTACIIMSSQLSDTSDFTDSEVRSIPNNFTYEELLTRKELIPVEKRTPEIGDYGINKNKDLHLFMNEKWLSINDR